MISSAGRRCEIDCYFSSMDVQLSQGNKGPQMTQPRNLHTVLLRTLPEICGWAPLTQQQHKMTRSCLHNPNKHQCGWLERLQVSLCPFCYAMLNNHCLSTRDSRTSHCSPAGCLSSCLCGWWSCRQHRWKTPLSTLLPSSGESHWEAHCREPDRIHQSGQDGWNRIGPSFFWSPCDHFLTRPTLYRLCFGQMSGWWNLQREAVDFYFAILLKPFALI